MQLRLQVWRRRHSRPCARECSSHRPPRHREAISDATARFAISVALRSASLLWSGMCVPCKYSPRIEPSKTRLRVVLHGRAQVGVQLL